MGGVSQSAFGYGGLRGAVPCRPGRAVDGVLHQSSRTSDLLFKPVELVTYLSRVLTLGPGDLLFTGTPGGVGQRMVPPVFLRDGQTESPASRPSAAWSTAAGRREPSRPAPACEMTQPRPVK
jgi:hypothetical protein